MNRFKSFIDDLCESKDDIEYMKSSFRSTGLTDAEMTNQLLATILYYMIEGDFGMNKD